MYNGLINSCLFSLTVNNLLQTFYLHHKKLNDLQVAFIHYNNLIQTCIENICTASSYTKAGSTIYTACKINFLNCRALQV